MRIICILAKILELCWNTSVVFTYKYGEVTPPFFTVREILMKGSLVGLTQHMKNIESMAFKNVKLWNFVAIINVPSHDLFVDVLYIYVRVCWTYSTKSFILPLKTQSLYKMYKEGNKSYTEGKQYYLQGKRSIQPFFLSFCRYVCIGEDQKVDQSSINHTQIIII